MLFWFLLSIGIIITSLGMVLERENADKKNFPTILSGIGVLLILAAIILGITWLDIRVHESSYVAEQTVRYDSLMYQIENNVDNNDLVQQVTEWNAELASYKKISKNIWVGFLYYQCYDQFDFIPIELIE